MLQVNTLAGSDSVSLFRGVSPLLSLNIDGGADPDTIFPTGTAGPDSVQLVLSVTPSTVDVSMDGGSTFAHVLASDVSDSIDVQTLGGPDTIVAGNGLSTLAPLVLDGGPGPDTITGGDGNDTLFGGDDNDTVTGGRGTDVAFLGNGDDTFVWNPGDNSDIVEGQAGTDTLDFHGSNIAEKIDLSANGNRLRLTRDVAAITDGHKRSRDTSTVHRPRRHRHSSPSTRCSGHRRQPASTRTSPPAAGDGAADTVIVNGTDGRGQRVGVGCWRRRAGRTRGRRSVFMSERRAGQRRAAGEHPRRHRQRLVFPRCEPAAQPEHRRRRRRGHDLPDRDGRPGQRRAGFAPRLLRPWTCPWTAAPPSPTSSPPM